MERFMIKSLFFTSAKSLTLFNNLKATRGVPLLLFAISELAFSFVGFSNLTDAICIIFANSV